MVNTKNPKIWHTLPCWTKNFWRWYNEFDCHFRRHCFRCHCYCCQDQWWKVKTIITDEAFCRLSIIIHLACDGTWVAMVISCVQLHLKHVFISNWVLCSILPIFAGCHMDSPSVMMRGMIFVMQEHLSNLRQFLYNCFVSIVKVEKTMYPFLDLYWTSPSYCIDGGLCDMCDLFCAAGLNPHTCRFRLGAWLGLMVTATPRRNDVLPFIASEYDHIFFRCFAFICTVDQVSTNFGLTLKWLKEFHHRRHLCNDSDIYISWCDAESD